MTWWRVLWRLAGKSSTAMMIGCDVTLMALLSEGYFACRGFCSGRVSGGGSRLLFGADGVLARVILCCRGSAEAVR